MATRQAIPRPGGLALALIVGWFVAALVIGANVSGQSGSAREPVSPALAVGPGAETLSASHAGAVLLDEESPALTIGVVAVMTLIGGTVVLLRTALGAGRARLERARRGFAPRPVVVVVDNRSVVRRSAVRH